MYKVTHSYLITTKQVIFLFIESSVFRDKVMTTFQCTVDVVAVVGRLNIAATERDRQRQRERESQQFYGLLKTKSSNSFTVPC